MPPWFCAVVVVECVLNCRFVFDDLHQSSIGRAKLQLVAKDSFLAETIEVIQEACRRVRILPCETLLTLKGQCFLRCTVLLHHDIGKQQTDAVHGQVKHNCADICP